VSCEQITFSTNECKTLRLLLLRSRSSGTAVHIAFILFLFPLSYPSPHPPWTTLSNLAAPSRSPLTGIDSPSPGAHLQTPCLLGSNCDISLVASSSSFHFHFIPFSFCLGPAHDPVERLSTSSASSATPLFLPVRHSPSPAAVSPLSTAVSSSSTAVLSAAVLFTAISSSPTTVSSSAVTPPFPHHPPLFLLRLQPLHLPLPFHSCPSSIHHCISRPCPSHPTSRRPRTSHPCPGCFTSHCPGSRCPHASRTCSSRSTSSCPSCTRPSTLSSTTHGYHRACWFALTTFQVCPPLHRRTQQKYQRIPQ
jgi:hypothetical protein